MSKSNQLKQYFLSHRHVTNDLIAKLEKDQYDYKPTPSSMSTKELVLHMLTSFYRFTAAAAKQAPEKLHNENEDIDLNTLAELYTGETVRILDSLSDEDLNENIDLTAVLGVELPAKSVINLAIDHEINHKGNLFVYVRLLGNTDLPMFVKK